MRLDVLLSYFKYIKRRTVAKKLCDNGFVLVNGRIGKPSTDVKNGDFIEITLGDKVHSFDIEIVSNINKKNFHINVKERKPKKSEQNYA